MKLFGVLIAVAIAWGVAIPPAHALTITNGHDKSVKVTIEKWQRRINPGDSATFNPSENPTKIAFEARNFYVTCEAGPDDEVRIEDNTCYVNGEQAGRSDFRL